MDSAARRLQALRDHLDPAEAGASRDKAGAAAAAPLTRQPTAAHGDGGGAASSSYARVHGEVSKAPAVWRDVPSVARETLQEVLYQKADADGIARVRHATRHAPLHCLCMRSHAPVDLA